MSLAVTIGSVSIDFLTVWKSLAHHLLPFVSFHIDEATDAIIWQLRLPRVLLAAVVGASLAVAGVVFQALLRNPLADPYILGVSAGSATGAALAMITGWGALWLGRGSISIFAFLGACLALFFVLRLAQIGDQMRTGTLILSGVVVNALFGAILTCIIALSPEEMQQIQYWLMGGLGLREWKHLAVVTPVLFIGFTISWLYSRELNLLGLGDRPATHLGVSVVKVRIFLLVIASLITGVAVSVSGTIGFVGLVIPHLLRLLTGADHRTLLPLSMIAGATFLVGADCIARVLLSPIEIPIGVVTAFIGAPFFAMILRKHQHKLSQ
ncbi:FecCD family ABC transporter permease [Hazenella coriacea]|uniref:FecCD family ABC transporter permease n=1 Tax=Hazenella coriacea TaxID=1179467 RepID=UPI001A9D4DAE|nr:iron ABC transporter permease [Hazenella coriacea]